MWHFPCPKRSRTICEFAKRGTVEATGSVRLNARPSGLDPIRVHNPNFISSIIAGGSIAGMLTVRVYHDYFKRVLLVEPERWLFGNCETTLGNLAQVTSVREIQYLSHFNTISSYFKARSSWRSPVIIVKLSVNTSGTAYDLPHFGGAVPVLLYSSSQSWWCWVRKSCFHLASNPTH